MKSNSVTFAILFSAFFIAAPVSAQTADTPAKAPAPAKKTTPAKKPKMDLDGFFKDAEKQTREEYEKGGNCLPKPKDYTPKEPVA